MFQKAKKKIKNEEDKIHFVEKTVLEEMKFRLIFKWNIRDKMEIHA